MHCPYINAPSICGAGEPDPTDMLWFDEEYSCTCTYEYYVENCRSMMTGEEEKEEN